MNKNCIHHSAHCMFNLYPLFMDTTNYNNHSESSSYYRLAWFSTFTCCSTEKVKENQRWNLVWPRKYRRHVLKQVVLSLSNLKCVTMTVSDYCPLRFCQKCASFGRFLFTSERQNDIKIFKSRDAWCRNRRNLNPEMVRNLPWVTFTKQKITTTREPPVTLSVLSTLFNVNHILSAFYLQITSNESSLVMRLRWAMLWSWENSDILFVEMTTLFFSE